MASSGHELSASCRAAALLIAQHTQALTEVLVNLQVLLAEAAKCDAKSKEAEELHQDAPTPPAAPAVSPEQIQSEEVAAPTPTTLHQTPEPPPPQRGGKGHGKGQWSPWPSFKEDEPRFDGWTSSQWTEWVQTPCGNTWCSKKRVEAETIADWMVQSWGISALRAGSGVLDIGGEPGFLAAALLSRGVPVTVVDTFWRRSGKQNRHAELPSTEEKGFPDGARFEAIAAPFDEKFVAEHQALVDNASALVSLYGDEATTPCLQYASSSRVPCLVVPCNECVRFFPPHQRNYEGYAQALLADANAKGGRFQRAVLQCTPFSRVLLVQLPDTEQGQRTRQQLDIVQQQLCQQQFLQQHQQQQMQQMQQHQPICQQQLWRNNQPQHFHPQHVNQHQLQQNQFQQNHVQTYGRPQSVGEVPQQQMPLQKQPPQIGRAHV